jgi:2-keto-4-pentenoate hydratase/2-oxohepta-3-ene-1,7-dioic acid hydratase in catechol pathway
VELVAVVGKRAKQVWVEEAYDYVLGYSVGQDLTARDWVTGVSSCWVRRRSVPQGPTRDPVLFLEKAMDTLCPLRDEIADPHSLQLKIWVNVVLKQNGVTSRIVHRIDKFIAHLSM